MQLLHAEVQRAVEMQEKVMRVTTSNIERDVQELKKKAADIDKRSAWLFGWFAGTGFILTVINLVGVYVMRK